MMQSHIALTVCGFQLLHHVSALLGSSWPLDGHPKAGFGQDIFNSGISWSHQSPKEDWPGGVKRQIGIRGNNRLNLVDDYLLQDWATAAPISFDLLGKSVFYTVDMTNVPCGTLASLYFVENQHPGASSNYCDILKGGCYEIDIMEANSVAWEASTHVQTGDAFDGSCNEMGCSNNIGRYPFTPDGQKTTELYGPGAYIDTNMLFQVQADITMDGYMQVTLRQNGNKSLVVYNRTMAGNIPDIQEKDAHDWRNYPKQQGVPEDAARKTVEVMMQKGVRLVLSVWGDDDTHWLDHTGCIERRRGTAADAQVKIYDLSISPTPGVAAAEPAQYFTKSAPVAAGNVVSHLAMVGTALGLLAAVTTALLVAGVRSRRAVGWSRLQSMPLEVDSDYSEDTEDSEDSQ